MHSRLIWLLALIVGFWLLAGPLMACPYMSQPRSCCPATHHSGPQKCPFSSSIQLCPIFATQAKVGQVEAKLQGQPALEAFIGAQIDESPVEFYPARLTFDPPDPSAGADLLHRLQVLRI